MKVGARFFLVSVLVAMLAACATAPGSPSLVPLPEIPATPAPEAGGILDALTGLKDKALESIGIKKPALPSLPDVPDSALPDWKVQWRIYASDSLNIDAQGHSLALLTRIYKLKSPDAFLLAPAAIFGDPSKEKEVLGDDLVSVREVQLVPGQHHESQDKASRDTRFIGIVGLFRSPSVKRWRYAFSTPQIAKSGVSIGAHACALSVQVGEPIGVALGTVRSAAQPCP
jgi:type VI secretion system protein VasD